MLICPSSQTLPPRAICNTEFVMVSAPPLVMMQLLKIRNGVLVPALLKTRVLVAPLGAEIVKLLMVIVAGELPAVVESIVTVLLLALVTKTATWEAEGP